VLRAAGGPSLAQLIWPTGWAAPYEAAVFLPRRRTAGAAIARRKPPLLR
jgi:hypothetical protein